MAKTHKPDVEKFLGDGPDEHVFRCHDGSTFRNMRELRDEKLARDLVKSPGKLQVVKIIAERFCSLSTNSELKTAV